MITVYYLLDKRKAYKRSKEVPLLADVKYDHNGESHHFRFSTELKGNPKNFIRQSFHGRETDVELKNNVLNRITEITNNIYLDGIGKGSLPDKETFKKRIKEVLTDAKTEKTTLDHLADYTDHLKAKNKSKHTTLAMERLKSLLIELQAKGVSIHFDSIDLKFETEYLKLLKGKGYNGNTQGAYVNRLKMFLNWCVKNNATQNMIFKQFEITQEEKEVIALTELEVETIANLNLPKHQHIDKGMKLTRDWFVISTQTGLRYSDLNKVQESVIKPVNGGFNLEITQQKTGGKVVIPLSRLAYKVLKEYDFEMPSPVSNQKYNKNLKAIATKAKLKKEISSHTGRKTFATNEYKNQTPVPFIMKITGHKTEKDFYRYIGVSLEENADKVRQANERYQIEHEPKMVVNQ